MGIFDQLGKLAGGAIPLAVQGVTAYQGGKQAKAQENAGVMRQLEQLAAQRERQAQQDALDAEYKRSMIAENEAQTQAAMQPKPQAPVPGTTEWWAIQDEQRRRAREDAAYNSSLTESRQRRMQAGAQGQVKLTEGERRGSALLQMAEQAAPIVLHAKAPNRMEALLGSAGLNEGLSADRQKVNQAASQLVSSYLYLVSGATATDEEIKRRTQELVPQPGDSSAVIAQKQQAVATMLRAMRAAAGRGADPSAPAAESPTLDGY